MKALHELQPPKSSGHYKGSTSDVIEQLRADGHDVSWYDKLPANYKSPTASTPAECGFFSMLLLEDTHAYTINTDGSKYMERQNLSRPEPKPCWYCSGCKQRFYDWESARVHREAHQ